MGSGWKAKVYVSTGADPLRSDRGRGDASDNNGDDYDDDDDMGAPRPLLDPRLTASLAEMKRIRSLQCCLPCQKYLNAKHFVVLQLKHLRDHLTHGCLLYTIQKVFFICAL